MPETTSKGFSCVMKLSIKVHVISSHHSCISSPPILSIWTRWIYLSVVFDIVGLLGVCLKLFELSQRRLFLVDEVRPVRGVELEDALQRSLRRTKVAQGDAALGHADVAWNNKNTSSVWQWYSRLIVLFILKFANCHAIISIGTLNVKNFSWMVEIANFSKTGGQIHS